MSWTKQSITEFVDSLLFWRSKQPSLIKIQHIIVHEPSFERPKPTQEDQPSASSSLSQSQLHNRLSKAFPDKDGFKIFTVSDTNSMEPYIDDNSLIVVERVDEGFILREGQVVVYQRPHPQIKNVTQLVLHRILELSSIGDRFFIKGDNNYFSDGWINRNQILYNLVGLGYYLQEEQGD